MMKTLLMLVVVSATLGAQSLTPPSTGYRFRWDPSPTSGVTRYEVRYRTADPWISVGLPTGNMIVLPVLAAGTFRAEVRPCMTICGAAVRVGFTMDGVPPPPPPPPQAPAAASNPRIEPISAPPPPPPPPPGNFDHSPYRTNTYGAPTHYCDFTKALNVAGVGTLANPWNSDQCESQPQPGNRVGLLRTGSNAVRIQTTGDDGAHAFQPARGGTSDTNRIIYVTEFAASALYDPANPDTIWSNATRTEIRTNAQAPRIVNGVGVSGLPYGSAAYGTVSTNYVTFDGFAIDMQFAYLNEDTGVYSVRSSTGVHNKNFVWRGANVTVGSNAVMYRPDNALDSVLSNFVAYGFHNDGTGSNTPQPALFNDEYGGRNSLIERFEIHNIDAGIFYKGTAPSGQNFNYGTVRYGIIHDTRIGFRFNDFDPTRLTEIHHNLVYNYTQFGLGLTSETSDPRNVLIHHNTFANGQCTDINCSGPLYIKQASSMLNVTIRDNILDWSGNFGHGLDAGELPCCLPGLDYNAYYKGGAGVTWAYNGAESQGIGAWRAASGREANSRVLTANPFPNRAGRIFTLPAGHALLTASSTGGQVGAYEGGVPLGPVR